MCLLNSISWNTKNDYLVGHLNRTVECFWGNKACHGEDFSKNYEQDMYVPLEDNLPTISAPFFQNMTNLKTINRKKCYIFRTYINKWLNKLNRAKESSKPKGNQWFLPMNWTFCVQGQSRSLQKIHWPRKLSVQGQKLFAEIRYISYHFAM